MTGIDSGTRQQGSREEVLVGTARAAYLLGVLLVVAGGLVAAVTGPLDLTHGSWLAAYLVLVCGVAQGLLATAQSALAGPSVPARVWLVQVVCWNLGNGLVIAGVLLRTPLVADVGAVPLLVTLGLAISVVRRPRPGLRMVTSGYIAVLAVLLVSIPIGLLLTHLRAG